MATPPHVPGEPLSAAQLQHWLSTMNRKRLDLHLRATDPDHAVRAQAFWEMGELLQEALEVVRVISTTFQEASEQLHTRLAEQREPGMRRQEDDTPPPR